MMMFKLFLTFLLKGVRKTEHKIPVAGTWRYLLTCKYASIAPLKPNGQVHYKKTQSTPKYLNAMWDTWGTWTQGSLMQVNQWIESTPDYYKILSTSTEIKFSDTNFPTNQKLHNNRTPSEMHNHAESPKLCLCMYFGS